MKQLQEATRKTNQNSTKIEILNFTEMQKLFKRKTASSGRIQLDDKQLSLVCSDPDIQGIVILRNHINPSHQKLLIIESLNNCNKLPNLNNLHKYFEIPDCGLWNLYENYYYNNNPCTITLNQIVHDHNHSHVVPLTIQSAIRSIRWINLGMSYDWSNKSYYDPLKSLVKLPPNLINPPISSLIKSVVLDILKASYSKTGFDPLKYKSDAGIINLYGLKDTLMAHQDKSENDSESPLVSISIGHSCVFLIGTEDRNDQPIPIILNSGDSLVMFGVGRRRFHSVPRILENTLPLYLFPSSTAIERYISELDSFSRALRLDWLHKDLERIKIEESSQNIDRDWDVYGQLLLESRVNINIRQMNRE